MDIVEVVAVAADTEAEVVVAAAAVDTEVVEVGIDIEQTNGVAPIIGRSLDWCATSKDKIGR